MAKDELIDKFKYIGTRPNRPDGLDKVTGRAKLSRRPRVHSSMRG